MKNWRNSIIAFIALTLSGSALGDLPQQENADIKVRIEGDTIVNTATMRVPATPEEVWAVLTDYDHMAAFLPNIDYSKTISNADNKLLVEQQGKIFFGPFWFSFDYVQEVTLIPFREIHSRLVSGSFKKLEGRILLIPSGDETLIIHSGASNPTIEAPRGIVASMTEQAVRDQLGNMQREILRRKNTARKQ